MMSLVPEFWSGSEGCEWIFRLKMMKGFDGGGNWDQGMEVRSLVCGRFSWRLYFSCLP